jgi:hypothetical protein
MTVSLSVHPGRVYRARTSTPPPLSEGRAHGIRGCNYAGGSTGLPDYSFCVQLVCNPSIRAGFVDRMAVRSGSVIPGMFFSQLTGSSWTMGAG